MELVRWRLFLSIFACFVSIGCSNTIISSDNVVFRTDNESDVFEIPRTFYNSLPNHGALDDNAFGLCGCKPKSLCPTDKFSTLIDIRIVTPPAGTQCEPGQVYCCGNGADCGRNRDIKVPDMPPISGQSNFGEFPWQVLILTLSNDYVGSGALVTTTHVLTAAHRLTYFTKKGQRLFVRSGDWDVLGTKEPYPFTDMFVSQVTMHPQYDPKTLQFNVAILTLLQPVKIAPNINTVCLPQQNTCFSGKTCWVSGWGKDMFGPSGKYQSVQKKIDLPVIGSNECELRLRNTKLGPDFQLDQESFLCAGGVQGKDACTGDGGSPLVCQHSDGRWILAGLVAWGIGCAQQGVPGVYVNVPNMVTWIQQQIQQPYAFDRNIR